MQLQFRRFTSIICLALALALPGTVARGGTCFVWRVTNTPAPCYLVGTIHALSAHDYPLPAGYDQAFRDTQRLVFEMKPDMKSDFSRKFDKAMMYPTGDGVQRHVHPKTWEIIKVNFSTQNMLGHAGRLGDQHVANGIQQLRPWAIAYLFYGILGYSDVYSSLGVDHHLWLEGKRKHKEFAGLETDDEHVQVLGGLNDIESELILLDSIARRDKQKGEYEDMRAAWKRGDTSGLWRMCSDSVTWIPALMSDSSTCGT